MTKIFRLTTDVEFRRPRGYIALWPPRERTFTVPAGTLVLYYEQEDGWTHRYRILPDGRVGLLDTPPDERFAPVEDPVLVSLAGMVKTLPEMLAEKGLRVRAISALDPFNIIACPMCGGNEFITLDFASVWCDRCDTRFTARETAGDPGVVVDADLTHYSYFYARYVIPRRRFTVTVVLKDFGYSDHPEGRCGPGCVNGTTYEERAARGYVVHAPTSLQDNTRWCGLEVYDWALSGTADPHFVGSDVREVRGEEGVNFCILGKTLPPRDLPPLDLLADGDEEWKGREWWYLVDVLDGGYPVWWKVRAVMAGTSPARYIRAWEVVDKSLCPICLRPVDERYSHEYCEWKKVGWSPKEA